MQAPLSQEILQGLATCRWSGRNEIIDTNTATYYLDGAQYVRLNLVVEILFCIYRLVLSNQ